jgi:GMP synthase (glutamine-hydrolysing)
LVDERGEEGYTIVMRAVKTKDFLKAESMRIPWITLNEAAARIFESCNGVAKVYYDVTPKPPATIEYE